jgi:CheY-like chemotaxis protein
VGSTFTATLPAQRRTEQAPALPGHLSAHNDRPARALVIEDQPLIADVISHRLRERGFEVRCAASRHEALQQLEQAGPFDLITLDDALPDASGLETIEAIRDLERARAWLGARVVSISASPDVTRPPRYRAAGIAATLCKPIDWPAFDVATHCTAMNPARALRPAAATPLDVLAVYRTQIPQDIAALREAIVAHEWRRALAMSHRIRGAASMVGDAATLVTLDQIDGCLKHHAINGDPGAADLDEIDRLLAQMDPGT